MRTHIWLYRVVLLPLFVSAAGCGVQAEQSSLSVPPDESFPLQGYLEKGIPDPATSWSFSQYQGALHALASLPRERLPRRDSGESGLVFHRLLISHHAFPDAALAGRGPGLSVLYGAAKPDGLLFDRELVAIRLSGLEELVKEAPTSAQVREAEEAAATLYRKSQSAEVRAQSERALTVYAELLQNSSAALLQRLMDVLYLLSLPELSHVARAEVLRGLSEVLPLLPDRMVQADAAELSEHLAGLSRLAANSLIRGELLALAEMLANVNREDRHSAGQAPTDSIAIGGAKSVGIQRDLDLDSQAVSGVHGN